MGLLWLGLHTCTSWSKCIEVPFVKPFASRELAESELSILCAVGEPPQMWCPFVAGDLSTMTSLLLLTCCLHKKWGEAARCRAGKC